MLTRTMKQTRPGSTGRKSVYALGFAISAMFLLSACSDEAAEESVAEVCNLVLEHYPYAHRGLVRDGVCS